MVQVLDGTSNTILLGEMLPQFSEFQRYTTDGWIGGNDVAQGQTIQPINWPIDPVSIAYTNANAYQADCTGVNAAVCPSGPTHCMYNWHVTWGFHSNHPGGANSVLADGSVHFPRCRASITRPTNTSAAGTTISRSRCRGRRPSTEITNNKRQNPNKIQ